LLSKLESGRSDGANCHSGHNSGFWRHRQAHRAALWLRGPWGNRSARQGRTGYPFRVIGAKAAPGSLRGIQGLDSPLIGRDADMESLRQTVDQFMMGNGIIRHRFSWILWQSPLQPQFQRQWRSKRPHPSTPSALLQMQPRPRPTNPYSCFNVAIGDIVHSVRQFVR